MSERAAAAQVEAAYTGDAPDADVRDIVGLCLSGGGYKASLFHLGALWRLNEMGLLPKLARISSVSGGSITAGLLASRWEDLKFDDQDVGQAFETEVAAPLWRFCRKARLDIPSVILGLLTPFRSAADALAGGYDNWLFHKAKLDTLPDEASAPRFIFNATSPQLNSLWRMTRTGARNYRVGHLAAGRIHLAQAVAASSAFPPVMSPMTLRVRRGVVADQPGADRNHPPWSTRIQLSDGGIYDNMGLEAVWKRCKTVIVCNAGDVFPEAGNPTSRWLPQLSRTVKMIHRQAENNRIRWLMALDRLGERRVAYFGLRGAVGAYPAKGLDPGAAKVALARGAPVRLWPMKEASAIALVHHGYALADVAVRSFWPEAANRPPAERLPSLPPRGPA